jgi:hypothetical protein
MMRKIYSISLFSYFTYAGKTAALTKFYVILSISYDLLMYAAIRPPCF